MNKLCLRVERDSQENNNYFVCCGEGVTFRVFGIAIGIKNAQRLMRAVKKDPLYYGYIWSNNVLVKCNG